MLRRWKCGMVCAGAFLICFAGASAQTPAVAANRPSGRPLHVVPACVVRKTMDKTLKAEVVADPSSGEAARSGFYIQAGSFTLKANAARLTRLLESEGYSVHTHEFNARNGRLFHVVCAGPFPSRDEADAHLRKISAAHSVAAILVPAGLLR